MTGAKLLDASTQTVTIPKQGEHRIDWRVSATQVGELKLLALAKAVEESDGVEIPLEVVPHGLKQTLGGASAVSEDNADKTIALDLPSNAHAQARSLRIEAAPSITELNGKLQTLQRENFQFHWKTARQEHERQKFQRVGFRKYLAKVALGQS